MHHPDEDGNSSILHMDVKHENFCFGLEDSAHIENVIDFGLSTLIYRARDADPEICNVVEGTTLYMSTMQQSELFIQDYMDNFVNNFRPSQW